MASSLAFKTLDAMHAARATGLDVALRDDEGKRCIHLTTPPYVTELASLRLTARLYLDPDPELEFYEMQSIDIQIQLTGETSWSQYSSNPLPPMLVEAWLGPVLSLLHHQDPESLRDELALMDDWCIQQPLTQKARYAQRREERHYGRPQYGDLCVCDVPSEEQHGRDTHILRILGPDPATSDRHIFDVLPINGLCRSEHSFRLSPFIFPYVRKLGLASIERLPENHLSAHLKLKLLDHQNRLNTARAAGPITDETIDALWRGAVAPS